MELCRFLFLLCATLVLKALDTHAAGRRRVWRLRRQLCPKDYMVELGLCRREVIALSQNGIKDVRRLCRAHLGSLDCLQSIFQACYHLPDVQALANMMDISNLRLSMERQCPEEFRQSAMAAALKDGCPGMQQFARMFERCADQYNKNAFHARMSRRRCRRAAEGLECLDTLSKRCGRFAHIRQYSFDWVNLRNKCHYPEVDTSVEEEEEEEEENEEETPSPQTPGVPPPQQPPPPRQHASVARKHEPCPPGYMEEFKLCRALGTSPHAPLSPQIAAVIDCSSAYRELECLEDLVTRCWDQPVIQSQLHRWDPVQFRQELDEMCRQHV